MSKFSAQIFEICPNFSQIKTFGLHLNPFTPGSYTTDMQHLE